MTRSAKQTSKEPEKTRTKKATDDTANKSKNEAVDDEDPDATPIDKSAPTVHMSSTSNKPFVTTTRRGDKVVAKDYPLDQITAQLDQNPDNVVWVDLSTDVAHQIHELAKELPLHDLAVQDALGPHQRPKLDHYTAHQFLALRALTFDPETAKLSEYEMDAFVSKRWLVTFSKDKGFDTTEIDRRLNRHSPLAKYGVAYWLYVVLDVVVDDYTTITERFEEWYDDLSSQIFSGKPLPAAVQQRWFTMRRNLVRLHRLAFGMREVLSQLIRRADDQPPEIKPYYEDVLDHIIRELDTLDSLRALDNSVVDTNVSLQDYRQNEVMKKVSSWAAIIGVPTFVTGYYGMNVPFPGNGKAWGFLIAATVGVLSVIVLYLQFKRRDWL